MTADAFCRCGHPIAYYANGWRHVVHERWASCPCQVAQPAAAATA